MNTARPSASRAAAERPKDRADRILAAALELFGQRGYDAVGIDEIGEAVGITGPGVYRHYESKQALLVSAAERLIEAYQDRTAAALEEDRSAQDLLRSFVARAVADTIQQRHLFAALVREAHQLPPATRRRLREKRAAAAAPVTEVLCELNPGLTTDCARFIGEAFAALALSVVYYQPQLSTGRLEAVLTRMGVAAAMASSPLDEAAVVEAVAVADGRPSVPRRRGARQEAILTVATGLFRRHGFSGVGIDEIGAAAGITGPGVYRHFRNKEDVLYSVLNRANEQLAAAANRALALGNRPETALRRLVESYLDLVIEDTDLMATYWREGQALGAERLAAIERSKRAYADDVAAVLRELRPKLAPAEARAMAYGLIAIMNTYWQSEYKLPTTEARPLLVSMAIAAVSA